MRNTGKYTMADVLAFRLRQRPVRAMAAAHVDARSLHFYLIAQMAGAGSLVKLLLLGVSYADAAQYLVIAVGA
jgi:cation/acetate symporter